MAISFVAASNGSGNTTANISSPSPSGLIGDLTVAVIGGKPYTQVQAFSVGTAIESSSATSGVINPANGSGSVFVQAAYMINPSTGTTNFVSSSTTTTPGDPHIHQTSRYRSDSGYFTVSGFSLADTDEAGATVSASGSVGVGEVKAGDMLVVGVIMKDDAITHSTQGLSIPGCALGPITWLTKVTTTFGGDAALQLGYVTVTAGNSNGSPATYTAISSSAGASATAIAAIIIREKPVPDPPTDLVASPTSSSIKLDWVAPTNVLVDSYNVYKTNPNILPEDESLFTNGIGSWYAPAPATTEVVWDSVNKWLEMRSLQTTLPSARIGTLYLLPETSYQLYISADSRWLVGSNPKTFRLSARFINGSGAESSTGLPFSGPNTSYETTILVPEGTVSITMEASLNTGPVVGDIWALDNLIMKPIARYNTTTTSYTDSVVVPEVDYSYVVRGISDGAEGGASSSLVSRLSSAPTAVSGFGIPL